jgi:23S rRNA (cytidine1920-2'-O)/16S rRNA (cytidine1409-2'-O)-methyltransferase
VRREPPRFVSRGGLKLERALEEFSIDVSGLVALDAGASTGGFTDCLLARGAARVYAVDVGYGQLAWKLRSDDRVVVMERTNIRAVERASLVPPPQLVVADLAFVSLVSVLGVLVGLLPSGGLLVALVKPQFEVEREELEGGVVRDDAVRERALARVLRVCRDLDLEVAGNCRSPVTGADGNVEYLLAARRV